MQAGLLAQRVILLLAFTIGAVSGSVQAQNENISGGLVFDGEPYITINPANSQHMVVAWMSFELGKRIVIRTKRTLNAGQTWSSPIYIPHTTAGFTSADVSLQFDSNGNVFLCFVDYDPAFSGGGTYVVKSTDGGLTWGAAVEANSILDDPGKLGIDRPWMVIDRSSAASQGNIYVTSMNADQPIIPPPYNPYFVRSTDGGASFDTPRYLDTTSWLAGNLINQPMPTPAVATDGTFYAVYPSYVASQNPFPQFVLATSQTAGGSFSYGSVYAGVPGTPDSLAKNAPLLLTDPSDANHLALIQVLQTHGDGDIFLRETYNAGSSWTAAVRVNDDVIGNGFLQDLVWADFDTDGDLAVCWRDRRNGVSGTYETATEIFGAVLWKDSSAFSANVNLSDLAAAHDTILNGSGNDFLSVQFVNDTVNTVWGDIRTGTLSIWFNRWALGTNTTTVTEIVREEMGSLKLFPNPAKAFVTIEGFEPPFDVEIFSTGSELVKKWKDWPSRQIATSGLEQGIYYLRIAKDGKLHMGPFVVE